MKNVTYFENDMLVLDVKKLTFKRQKKEVALSKYQTRLIDALIKGINEKEALFSMVWNDSAGKNKENSFNQLIFRTRILLSEHGLPDDFIITIPRYGLCINRNYISRVSTNSEVSTRLYNDHSCLC